MTKKQLPTLSFKTKRLVVRPLEIKDFDAWKSAYRNTLIKQNEFDENFILKKDCECSSFKTLVRQFRTNTRKGLIFQLFAFHRSSDALIGSAQYSLIQRFETQKAYLGYSILNNHWRQGHGFELADGMIEHAFKKVK